MKAVKKDVKARSYCGPTILASITGKPMSKVRETIRNNWDRHGERYDRAGRNRPVTGTSTGDIRQAFSEFGWTMNYVQSFKRGERPTVAAFLRSRTPEQRKQTLVLIIGMRKRTMGRWGWSGGAWSGGHWVAVTGKKFVDTFTDGKPVWLKDAPHRRKRVASVFVVTKK